MLRRKLELFCILLVALSANAKEIKLTSDIELHGWKNNMWGKPYTCQIEVNTDTMGHKTKTVLFRGRSDLATIKFEPAKLSSNDYVLIQCFRAKKAKEQKVKGLKKGVEVSKGLSENTYVKMKKGDKRLVKRKVFFSDDMLLQYIGDYYRRKVKDKLGKIMSSDVSGIITRYVGTDNSLNNDKIAYPNMVLLLDDQTLMEASKNNAREIKITIHNYGKNRKEDRIEARSERGWNYTKYGKTLS